MWPAFLNQVFTFSQLLQYFLHRLALQWQPKRPLSATKRENICLLAKIKDIHEDSLGVIGAPRMREDLVDGG